MSLNDTTSLRSRTLAAFFDTKGAAETAIKDIEALGIPKQHITMVAGGSTTAVGATATAPQHEGFLQSLKDLFMPEEDQYSYAEGLRRGGYLVSIKSDEANYNRILDILDRDGAVDMDERVTTWRSEGWTNDRFDVHRHDHARRTVDDDVLAAGSRGGHPDRRVGRGHSRLRGEHSSR